MQTTTFLAAALAMTFALGGGAARAQHHDRQRMPMAARYGGPSYGGKPALAVTAALVEAGGGAQQFDIVAALVSMVGEDLVKAEVGRLTKQYGEAEVKTWIEVFNFAVKKALTRATDAGVKLPMGELKGRALAAALVEAGAAKDGTFYVEFMLDKAVSNPIHHAVMDDIDAQFSADADAIYHKITNQAMYDLAQALGVKKIKLAAFH